MRKSVKFEPVETTIATARTVADHKIGALPPEQQAIRAKCFHRSGTFLEFTKQEIEQSIPQRFEKIANRYPERLALQQGYQRWTYDALNISANRFARNALHRVDEKHETMALIAGNDCRAIIAYLGILKAAKVAVVIDPSFPSERSERILADSQARCLVSDNQHLELAKALAHSEDRVINLDALEENPGDENLGLNIAPDATAQILYTSGSTGQPKGVFFNHRRLLYDVMENANAARICPEDRLTYFGKLTFGAGIKELFRGLLCGAAIFPYEISEDGLGKLPAFLTEQGITIFKPSVSTFRYFVNGLNGSESFPLIRLLILGGDPITISDVDAYKRIFSEECLLLHGFSSTEAGLLCLNFIDKQTEIAATVVPVGYPVQEKEIYLVDDSGVRVEGDAIGEIAVRSRYVSTGYWRDQELSDAKFQTAPSSEERICLTGDLGRMRPDGRLVHLGRKEFVVKVRGYRVAIGEVEAALRALDKVKEAAVIATPDGKAESLLTAYVVPKENSPIGPTILRHRLREKLPEFMIPQSFVLLDALPLTASGKIDRNALPHPGNSRPQIETPYVEPTTGVEKVLAKIWGEALHVDTVGIHDDFLDLGGHSLSATRIIGKINETFGIEISMRSLLDNSTVAQLAHLVAVLSEVCENTNSDSAAGATDEEIGEL